MTCGTDDPCGNALLGPNCAPPPPGKPWRWCAADVSAPYSAGVMPSRRPGYAAAYALSVTFDARRISSSSWASLNMRQPAVTAVALTNRIAGAAWAMLSANTNRTVSSMPTRPVATPRAFRARAVSSKGLSVSCHVSNSAPLASGLRFTCSPARSASNAGQMMAGLPFAGRITANMRSLWPQRRFVK